MKSFDMRRIVKYVIFYVNINDIKIGLYIFFDLFYGYFMGRIKRFVFYFVENYVRGEEFENYVKVFGIVFLRFFVESIYEVVNGGEVDEIFIVCVKNIMIVYKMVIYFERLGVKIYIEDIEDFGNGYWRIIFKWVYLDVMREIWELWNGLVFVD